MFHIVALTAVLLFSAVLSRAELDPKLPISRYIHQSWSDQQGLPQNNILALAQTHDGFLWFGTEAGLVRFDGVHFAIYDKHNTAALKSDAVTAILEDRRQNLWIGTTAGLVRFHNQAFTSFPLPAGKTDPHISALYEDPHGTIWVGTDGNGIAVLKDGALSAYRSQDGLAGDAVFSINGTTDGSVWVGTQTGLSRWKNGRFTTYTKKNGLPNDFICAVYPDSYGGLWIGTQAGLSRLLNGKFRNYTTKDGLSSNLIQFLYEDRQHTLWIGTFGGGLNRFHDGLFSNYRMKDGLSAEDVVSIFGDRDGALWVGTLMGLNRFAQGKVTTLTSADGLPSNTILATYQDPEGDLWIGTADRGLVRIHNGKVETYGVKQGLSNDTVFTVVEDRDHSFWIGTRNGLNRLKDGKITTFTSKDGLAGDGIMASLIDRHGVLWVAGRGGLSRFQGRRFTAYSKGISELRVTAIAEDLAGALWLGSDGGLIRFQGGSINVFTTKNSSLSDDRILSLYEDPHGTLWIGTHLGGLNRLQNGTLTSFRTKDGLLGDQVDAIVDGDDGNLWLSSNRGIYRVQAKQIEDYSQGKAPIIDSLVIDTQDGMLTKECNGGFQPSAWRTSDGTILFPTMRGVALIDPRRVELPRSASPVYLDKIQINKKIYTPGTDIISPSGRGELQFEYSAPNFSDPQRVEFQYRLEGYDHEWVTAGGSRVVRYTNIPPGDYRFRVRARQGFEPWTGMGTAINVTLRAPFYRTLWFYCLCGLAGSAIAFAMFQLRVMRLKAHERNLLILVNQRTAELQEEIRTRKQAEADLKQARDDAIRARDLLHFQATHDVLTEVWNRGAILDCLKREIDRGNRNDCQVGLLMLDVDYFKNVNDTYGHPCGDIVLRDVAFRISEAVRQYDSVGRYGGEEFIIVMPNCDEYQALQNAERIRLAIEAKPIYCEATQIKVTVSIGAVAASPNEASVSQLLTRADAALYEAKLFGRNRSQLSKG